jgi:hypothetical protein
VAFSEARRLNATQWGRRNHPACSYVLTAGRLSLRGGLIRRQVWDHSTETVFGGHLGRDPASGGPLWLPETLGGEPLGRAAASLLRRSSTSRKEREVCLGCVPGSLDLYAPSETITGRRPDPDESRRAYCGLRDSRHRPGRKDSASSGGGR